MPGNVAAASPSGILPQTLCLSFMEERSFAELQSMMHDGTILRGQLVADSRRTFKLSKKLAPAALATLKTLWDSNGNTIPISFYNPFEPISGQPIGSNYDASGASTQGRYTVVFGMASWSQVTGLARTEIPDISLREVA